MKLHYTNRPFAQATVIACGILSTATSAANPTQPAANFAGIGYYINGDLALPLQGEYKLTSSGSSAFYSGCTVSTATLTACASSIAKVGALGNKSFITDTNPSSMPGYYESSNGFSWFRDVLTVNGLVNGTYMIVPTVTIHGTSSWNGVLGDPGNISVGVSLVEWAPDGTTVAQSLHFDATSAVYTHSFQLQGIPFEPSVPFNFMIGFGEAASIFNPTNVVNPPTNTYVAADFLSTMSVTGLKVQDQVGNPVADFEVQSASGALYTTGGISPVPEPARLSLLTAGLLVLLGRATVSRKPVSEKRINSMKRIVAG